MTRIEQTTIQRYNQLINEYWKKYCDTKSAFLYGKWEEKRAKLAAYLKKMKDKYPNTKITNNSIS